VLLFWEGRRHLFRLVTAVGSSPSSRCTFEFQRVLAPPKNNKQQCEVLQNAIRLYAILLSDTSVSKPPSVNNEVRQIAPAGLRTARHLAKVVGPSGSASRRSTTSIELIAHFSVHHFCQRFFLTKKPSVDTESPGRFDSSITRSVSRRTMVSVVPGSKTSDSVLVRNYCLST